MVFCPCLLQGVSLQCCYLFIYFYMRLYVIFWFSSLFCTNRRLANISSELIHLGESRLFCPRNVPCFLKEICVSDQRPEGTLKHLPTPGWMSKKNFGWMKMAFNVQQLKSEPSQWARQHWHVPSQLHIFASEDLESLTCASKRPWKKTRKVPRCCSRPVWGVDSTQQFAAWVVLMLASRCCMSGNASCFLPVSKGKLQQEKEKLEKRFLRRRCLFSNCFSCCWSSTIRWTCWEGTMSLIIRLSLCLLNLLSMCNVIRRWLGGHLATFKWHCTSRNTRRKYYPAPASLEPLCSQM